MRTHRHKLVITYYMSLLTVYLTGCMTSTDGTSVDGHTENIIGGFPAESAALDAIGMVGAIGVTATGPNTPVDVNCSGTLIDEDTVVTAKHCIRPFATLSAQNRTMVFAIGSDSKQPKQVVPVVAVEGAPGDAQGFVGMGHDVAVLHLGKPITSVKFAKPAALSDEQMDQAFVGIGYGMRDNNRLYGQRLVGTERLKATKGRTLEALFGSFDAYFENLYRIKPADCPAGGAGAPALPPVLPTPPLPGVVVIGPVTPCSQLDSARRAYDAQLLETAHEFVMSVDDGDAQPCKGDSGGPVVQIDDAGELVTYGVTSGGQTSSSMVCDYGTVYASFMAPEVLEFVEEARSWIDPCANLAASGVCEGDVARRCSTAAEGDRRVLTFDCKSLGLACAVKEPGGVGCF